MENTVYWILELTIKPGKLESVQGLCDEMSAQTESAEPGTLNYEWMLNGDKSECQIFERYSDSGALLTHLGNFQEHFAGKFFEVFDIKNWNIYGDASPAVVEAIGGMGAQFHGRIGGFAR